MPKLFSVNHNSYINHFINEASYNSREKGVPIFMRHKNGYLVKTFFLLKSVLDYNKLSFSIVALIKPDWLDDSNYILLSEDGYIHGMTKEVKQML